MKLIFTLILFVFSSLTFSQITRGGEGEGKVKENNNGFNDDGSPQYRGKGEMAVNCNTDLELEQANNLIYHKKTGKPYTGLCISYYDNRQLERKVRFLNGKEQDTSFTFYKDGKQWTELSWDHGIENGTSKFWYENGQLAWENTYVMGEKEGIWSFYAEDGKPTKVLSYKANQMDGVSKYYHKNGILKKSVEYKKGIMNGEFTTYYDDST